MDRTVPTASGTAALQKSGNRTAFSPARLTGTVEDVVAALRPAAPLYVIRPDRVAAAARRFVAAFPGEVMYAVKANPDKVVIQTLYKNGVRTFDVASMEEVRLVRRLAPRARICLMHPVKAPEAIREAYYKYGVRTFVVDCRDELYKIMRETDLACDLEIFVRLALPRNGKAAIDFSQKFGAPPAECAELLGLCRPVAARLGLCFHVGTQTTDAAVYAKAAALAGQTVRKSGVKIDALDVGGGFPVSYPGQEDVPQSSACFDALLQGAAKEKLGAVPLLCEPGRALVAEAADLVVRVEQRKGSLLYLNDGTYGGLFDAGPLLKTRFPARAVRPEEPVPGEPAPFAFAGPTCDSLDMMPGPFFLPEGVACGDWIVIGNMGAYSAAMRSGFNGFGRADTAYLYDPAAAPAPAKPRAKT